MIHTILQTLKEERKHKIEATKKTHTQKMTQMN